jgi:hypothetical protein
MNITFGLGHKRLGLAAIAVAAACLTVLDASSVFAQPGGGRGPGGQGGFGGRGPGGGMGNDPLSIYRMPGVAEELELMDDQREELDAISREMREEAQAEMTKIQAKLAEKYKSKIERVLLPHQIDRAQQITLQMRGLDALRDPAIAERLGITESQIKDMEAKQADAQTKMRELFQNRDSVDDMRAEFSRLREEGQQAVMGVLSSSQKSKLEEMRGEPFEMRRPEFGRGQGGRGPGGEGGRGPGGRGPGGPAPGGD